MTSTFHLRLSDIRKRHGLTMLLAAGYILSGFLFLHSYLFSSPLILLLGSAGLAFALPVGRPGKHQWRFGITAVFCLVLYVFIPAKTFLFASILCALICLVEMSMGRMYLLTWFMLLFMTPVFEYICNVFSFPVRLQLTALAGFLLQLSNPGYVVEGNMITLGTSQFAVDPACMGLSMLTVSLLCSAIILAQVQKKNDRVFGMPVLLLYFMLVIVLNLACNLLRIITLVMLNIPPESSSHDGIGLISFVIYLVLPAYLLANWLARYKRTDINNNKSTTVKTDQAGLASVLHQPAVIDTVIAEAKTGRHRNTLIHVLLLALIGIAGASIDGSSLNGNVHPPDIAGYKNTRLGEKILKLESSNALIYIKPVAGFYSSDHNPMICWAGSGFEFRKVMETQQVGQPMYTSVLQKKNELLYTAWWYQSDYDRTVSQASWRWHSLLSGRRYVLVNITASSPALLTEEILRFNQQVKSIAR